MNKKDSLGFLFVFLLNMALNIFAIINGFFMVGTIMLLSTLLIYPFCYIWVVQKQEARFGFKNKIFVIPLGIIFWGLLKGFNLFSMEVADGTENLEAVGQMMLSRYQAVMWAFGIVLVVAFVMSASSVDRRKP